MGGAVVLDIEKIRNLIEMMVANDLVEISLRDGSEEINLRRPVAVTSSALAGLACPTPVFPLAEHAAAAAPAHVQTAAEPREKLIEIPSPMVGTFYAAANPESPPLVEVGSTIQAGTVVCILEAMKVFNEIKSEVAGIIERILVKNAQAVEYGQPMFLVRPS